MASGKSLDQANATLDMWIGGVVPTLALVWEVRLYTVAPSKTGLGTEVSASGTGYVPPTTDNDLVTWTVAANGRKTNAIEIVYPQALANYGTVVAVALVDPATLRGYWGLLNRAVIVTAGQTRFFPVNGIEVVEA